MKEQGAATVRRPEVTTEKVCLSFFLAVLHFLIYNERCCTIYRIGVSTFWLRRTIVIMNESFSFAPRRSRGPFIVPPLVLAGRPSHDASRSPESQKGREFSACDHPPIRQG